MYPLLTLLPLPAGFLLDMLLGDPPHLPHPVRYIGALITRLELVLRSRFPKSPRGELLAGAVLATVVPLLSALLPLGVLLLAYHLHPIAALLMESFFVYRILAARSLADESLAVAKPLELGDIDGGRSAVSRIVGRDTQSLDAAEVSRAAVETVAENTSDGVVAPLFYLALGGVPLGFFYKAVNTLDSMVGYKNERYLCFGRASARLDDVLNYIPSRLSGLLMVAAALLPPFDAKGAWRSWRRDRRKHPSINSAQTESACAGALGIQLGGSSSYNGVASHKPTLGKARHPIAPIHIRQAVRLMYATSVLALLLLGGLRLAVLALIF